jgi:hypothetical protein
MRWTLLLVLGVGLVASDSSAGDDKADAEVKALTGTWRVLAIEADGRDVPDERATKYRFVVAKRLFQKRVHVYNNAWNANLILPT